MRRYLKLLGALLMSGLVAAGCGQGDRGEGAISSQSAFTAGTAEVTLEVNSEWNTGYCTNVTIANKGTSAITAWKIVIDTHQSSVSNLWSGVPTTSGSQVTVVPFSWNANIAAGMTTVLGFCANKTGTDWKPEIVAAEVTGGGAGTGGTGSGGAAAGGSPAGGSAAGGTEAAGTAGTAGTIETGGSPAGGTESGGTESGGAQTAGTAGTPPETGGSPAGGTESGGTESGGAGTAGAAGAPPETGGTATGGAESGGTAGQGGTGGSAPTATVAFQSDWKSGYCVDGTITNPGTVAVTNWTLVIDVGQSTVSNLWNGTYTANGSLITVKPFGYNATIPGGTSIGFGFCGVTTGTNYVPKVVSLEVVGGGGGTGGTGAGGTATGGAATGGSATGGTATGGTATGGTGTGGTAPSIGTASLSIAYDWPAGYCANIEVTNETAAQTITDWTVVVELGQSTLSSSWSATYTTAGTRLTATPLSYNSNIAPGSSIEFGFCANKTGAASAPSLYSFNLVTGS